MSKLRKTKTKVTLAVIVMALLLFAAGSGIRSLITIAQSMFVKVSYPDRFQSENYDKLTHDYVRKNLVDYAKLKQQGLPLLDATLEELRQTNPERMSSTKEQLAFWINALNIAELKAICDRYPVRSMKKISSKISAQQFVIGGKLYTIQDLYAAKIVPLCKQVSPLAVFLVSQGAQGYPPLPEHLLTGENLDKDAEAAAYAFVNNKKNVDLDVLTNSLTISPYFEWTQDAYGKQYETSYDLVSHLHAEKIDFNDPMLKKNTAMKFNWRLNDTSLAINESEQ